MKISQKIKDKLMYAVNIAALATKVLILGAIAVIALSAAIGSVILLINTLYK